jgi:hypothetical protein
MRKEIKRELHLLLHEYNVGGKKKRKMNEVVGECNTLLQYPCTQEEIVKTEIILLNSFQELD